MDSASADGWGPSLVDWCEPNFVVHPRIAEFGNTFSSLVIVAMGLWGCWSVRGELRRFQVGMAGAVLVGVGSALFHGLLRRWSQAADELPMVALGLACTWTLAHRTAPCGEGIPSALRMAAFGACFTVAYAAVPWAFVLFVFVYALIVAWLAIRTVHLSFFRPAPPEMKRTAIVVIAAYIGGFFLFWVPEHVLLGCDHPLQALHLHSFWHIGAGIGTVAWWRWAILDRKNGLQMLV